MTAGVSVLTQIERGMKLTFSPSVCSPLGLDWPLSRARIAPPPCLPQVRHQSHYSSISLYGYITAAIHCSVQLVLLASRETRL